MRNEYIILIMTKFFLNLNINRKLNITKNNNNNASFQLRKYYLAGQLF